MVRNYKRKLIKLDETILSKAIEEITKGQKLQTIAKKYNIARGTLRGRMNKLTNNDQLHCKEVIFRDADFLPTEIIDRFQNESTLARDKSNRHRKFDFKLKKDKLILKDPLRLRKSLKPHKLEVLLPLREEQKSTPEEKSKQTAENAVTKKALRKSKYTRKIEKNVIDIEHGAEKLSVYIISSDDSDTCHK